MFGRRYSSRLAMVAMLGIVGTASAIDEPAVVLRAAFDAGSTEINGWSDELRPLTVLPAPAPPTRLRPTAASGGVVPAGYDEPVPVFPPPVTVDGGPLGESLPASADVVAVCVDGACGTSPTAGCGCRDECGPWARLCPALFVEPNGCEGIGRERVMFAPFATPSAEPFSHLSLRYSHLNGIERPDRAEFFWASPAEGGPGGDPSVDVDLLTARLEMKLGQRASTIFEAPLRSLNPTIAPNTTGLGDLVTGGKAVLVSGRDWFVTHQTLTHLKTGSVGRGLGTGHVTIEPGLLARFRWSDETYLHSQLRYFIPVGAADDYAGEVLVWGLGISHVWRETDAFAILPTLELVGTSFFDGQQTVGGVAQSVDGATTVELLHGARFVFGPAGDLGLPEFGVTGGFAAGDDGWVSGRFLIEARWSF